MSGIRHITTAGELLAGRACIARYALTLLAAALSWAGCALWQEPPPPALSQEQVLAALQSEAGLIRTVTSGDISLSMTFRTEEGKTERSPTFGGLVVFDADLPALWLRAEKVGREAFTLKALGGEFWLRLPHTREVVTGGPAAFDKLPHLIRPEELRSLLSGPQELGLRWPTAKMTAEKEVYRFDIELLGALYRRVTVDRRRLVITSIETYDVLGRPVIQLRLWDHARWQGQWFPTRVALYRPQAGVGIELRLKEAKFNRPVPRVAFQPAEEPGWRRVNLDVQELSEVQAFGAR